MKDVLWARRIIRIARGRYPQLGDRSDYAALGRAQAEIWALGGICIGSLLHVLLCNEGKLWVRLSLACFSVSGVLACAYLEKRIRKMSDSIDQVMEPRTLDECLLKQKTRTTDPPNQDEC